MARIPFATQAYQNRSLPIAAQQLINMYAEEVEAEGKNKVVLHGTPGLKRFGVVGNGPLRGMIPSNGLLYVVSGNVLYRVDNSGGETALGNVSSIDSPVIMSSNGSQVAIVDDQRNAWVFSDGVLTLLNTNPDFLADTNSVAYIDGFTIFGKPDGRFFISAIKDATTYDPTDYATAESDPNGLVRVFTDHNEIWLFGPRVTEIWKDVGNVDFPFQRVTGAVIERGCGAKFSVAKLDNVVFWQGDDKIIYRTNGYQPERISTHAIEDEIRAMEVSSDAQAFAYTQSGHKYYVITYPTAGVTFVFDNTTGLWHQRRSLDQGRWRANCFADCYGLLLVGDVSTGTIFSLDLDTFTEDGTAIERIASSPHLFKDRSRIVFNSFEIEVESGVGLNSGQGVAPTIALDWSDDGGRTWSNKLYRSVGAQGEYKSRAIWRRLGQARQRSFRIRYTDPTKFSVIAADADVSVGRA